MELIAIYDANKKIWNENFVSTTMYYVSIMLLLFVTVLCSSIRLETKSSLRLN